MRKITLLAALVITLVSINSVFAQDDLKTKQSAAVAQQAAIVTPESFQDFAEANVGKEVEIKGMVVHVCRHGGKKLFIIGEDPEMRVKINASDKVSVFEPELEGSTIDVVGVIEPIEEEPVPEEEKATQDADHSNYYHKPQYAISCRSIRTIDE